MSFWHRVWRRFLTTDERKLVIPNDQLPKQPADFVVAVGCTLAPGGFELSPQTEEIAKVAANRYRRGRAKALIALGSGYQPGQMPNTEAGLMSQLWQKIGIGLEDIVVADESYNTYKNALELRDTLEDLEVKSGTLIVVAQQLHAERVKLTFQKVLGPAFTIYIVKAECRYGGSSKWFLNSPRAFLFWDTLSLVYFKLRGWI